MLDDPQQMMDFCFGPFLGHFWAIDINIARNGLKRHETLKTAIYHNLALNLLNRNVILTAEILRLDEQGVGAAEIADLLYRPVSSVRSLLWRSRQAKRVYN